MVDPCPVDINRTSVQYKILLIQHLLYQWTQQLSQNVLTSLAPSRRVRKRRGREGHGEAVVSILIKTMITSLVSRKREKEEENKERREVDRERVGGEGRRGGRRGGRRTPCVMNDHLYYSGVASDDV